MIDDRRFSHHSEPFPFRRQPTRTAEEPISLNEARRGRGTMTFVPEYCGADRVFEVIRIYLAHRLCGIYTRHHLQSDLVCSQPCRHFEWRLGQ